MKILLVTPVKPVHFWQPHCLWRQAIIQLGHQVKAFPLSSRFLKPLTSWRLAQTISVWQPDHIFFSAGKNAVWPVNNTVFFSGVPFSMLSQHERTTGLRAKLIVTNDPAHAQNWLRYGARRSICLPISAAEPNLHHPVTPVKKYHTDVVFIGGLSLERQKLFQKLLQAKINLHLYGTLPDSFLAPSLKSIYRGPVWGRTLAKIYSSAKIALNPVPGHMPTGGNLRTFEIPACGAFQLASRTDPSWFINGKDIVIYKHPTDLIAKIKYYLHHPPARRKIAQTGYRRTHRDHIYQKRFKLLLHLLKNLPSHP